MKEEEGKEREERKEENKEVGKWVINFKAFKGNIIREIETQKGIFGMEDIVWR